MAILRLDDYHLLLRADFAAFVERSFYELHPETSYLGNWHLDLIASKLEQCRRGQIRRLIINVPPRSLKSHIASVAFPAWLLGHDPGAKILTVSYAQELGEKFAFDSRAIMQSAWYQNLFSTRLATARPPVHDLRTTAHGYRLSRSVGGGLTGRGGDFIIIDDPLKPDEALSDQQRKAVNECFDSTLLTRLNDKQTGCIVLIMQRLHENDLAGHLLERGGWELLRLPAIADEDETHEIHTPYGEPYSVQRLRGQALHPAREPLEVLAQQRTSVGEYNFAGQYQQQPAPYGGGLIKAEWFRSYHPSEIPETWNYLIQSWDTANKPSELSDYSVCTTWGIREKHLYLLDVFRKRLGYPELKRAVREQSERFNPNCILIEDKASGTQLIQELVYEGLYKVQRYEPLKNMNKTMRLHTASNMVENGFVHLPEKAPWLEAYVHELITFPRGKHDDQADSTSQVLDWMKRRYLAPTFTVQEFLV